MHGAKSLIQVCSVMDEHASSKNDASACVHSAVFALAGRAAHVPPVALHASVQLSPACPSTQVTPALPPHWSTSAGGGHGDGGDGDGDSGGGDGGGGGGGGTGHAHGQRNKTERPKAMLHPLFDQ